MILSSEITWKVFGQRILALALIVSYVGTFTLFYAALLAPWLLIYYWAHYEVVTNVMLWRLPLLFVMMGVIHTSIDVASRIYLKPH